MSWTHEHSWKLEAPPAQAYAALTEPSELTRWFAEHVDVDLPAGRYRFWGKHTLGAPEEAGRETITRAEPGRALGFSWTLFGVPTEVEIALAEEGGGTRLTLHHRVDGDLPLPRPHELIADHWRFVFGNLAAHLDGGDGIVLPDFTDPAPEVRMEIVINAPPAAVFRTLLDPEQVARWFDAPAPLIEPRVGGRYQLGWKYKVDGRDVEGGPTRILELVPDRKLVLDWPDWRGLNATRQRITFSLAPEGAGTRVTFVHSGFEHAADISDYPFGWRYFIDKLQDTCKALQQA